MKDRLLNFVKKEIIYNPVNSRVAYDFIAALISILTSHLIFSFANINIIHVFLFPIIFITLNFIAGVYSSLKLSPSWLKSLVMTSTSLFSSTLILFLGGDIALLLNSAIFLAALTSLPRVFLNLTNSSIKEPMLVQIIHSNSPIVVIGGGGYIGSTLVEKLLKNNSKVRVLDKFTYGKGVFDDLKKNNRLEIIKGDATDLSSLTLALRDAKAVVHLAGIVGDPASMVDDKLTRHMNIISTRMIKETVKGFRIPKFIFASSCSVYGASNNSLNERSRLNPLSPYAKSKIDSEKEILQDTFDEFHPTILRFATVFGHSRKPRFDLVLNLFAALAYNNEAIKVNGGNQWRPFIHATDAAQAIIKVIDAPTNKISRKIFNAGDDSLNITIMEAAKIVQSVFKKNGKNVKIIVRKGDADLRNCIVSFQKIKEQLGFFCQISIEEGISEIAKHFKKRTYKKPYTDSYYSALETTKEIKKEFYSKSYRKTHFSDFAF